MTGVVNKSKANYVEPKNAAGVISFRKLFFPNRYISQFATKEQIFADTMSCLLHPGATGGVMHLDHINNSKTIWFKGQTRKRPIRTTELRPNG